MTGYLWVGTNKENVMEGTHEVHLVMCLDCGNPIELINEELGKCPCREYIRLKEKWQFRETME